MATSAEKMRARLGEIADLREKLAVEYEELCAAMAVMERFPDDEPTNVMAMPWRGKGQPFTDNGHAALVAPEDEEQIDKDDLTVGQQDLLRILHAEYPLSPDEWFRAAPGVMEIKAFNIIVRRLATMGLTELTGDGDWKLTKDGFRVVETLRENEPAQN